MGLHVHPYPLVMANRNTTPDIRRLTFGAGLGANFRYVAGDLVRANAGVAEKLALGANGALTGASDAIYKVGQDWAIDPKNFEGSAVVNAFRGRGVPVDVIAPTDQWVFTLQTTAGTALTPANQAAVDALVALQGTTKDLGWDNAEQALVVLTGAGSANRVRVIEVYAAVGDSHPYAKVQFLPAFLGA